MWDPKTYQRYGDERARPFDELIARVAAENPTTVVDLGCGPGDRTATLLDRWPAARVIGVDSSAEMIDAAQTHAIDGRLIFEQANLREWEPEAPIDVLVSNATLQWVPGHLELLPRFVGMLAPKGWFAFQVPGNFGEPSHVLLHELRTSPRWREKLGQDSSRAAAVHDPATYLEALSDLGMTVDAWETTYLQVLFGDDAVLQWTKGTALRPVLAALGETEREQFLNEYGALLRQAYPQREYGTVFPFRRIFVVAYSKDA